MRHPNVLMPRRARFFAVVRVAVSSFPRPLPTGEFKPTPRAASGSRPAQLPGRGGCSSKRAQTAPAKQATSPFLAKGDHRGGVHVHPRHVVSPSIHPCCKHVLRGGHAVEMHAGHVVPASREGSPGQIQGQKYGIEKGSVCRVYLTYTAVHAGQVVERLDQGEVRSDLTTSKQRPISKGGRRIDHVTRIEELHWGSSLIVIRT